MDRVRVLMQIIPVGFIGSIVPTGFMAWVLRDQMDPPMLWAWIACIVLAHAVRMSVWFGARAALAEGTDASRWLLRLRTSVGLLGCSWALLPTLMPTSTAFDELLVTAVVAAVCGAGVAQLSSDAWSAALFIVPPFVPTSLRLIASADPSLRALGLLIILYFAFLMLAAMRIQASFLQLSHMRRTATVQSLRDALTGLPNRLALNLHLQEALARARRDQKEVAVCYIDLDDFKDVNDRFGHAAGDLLLKALAGRWRAQLRHSELIARLGGDEFVFVVEEIDSVLATQQLSAVFGRLHDAVVGPVALSAGASARVGLTMGVARFPQDGGDPDQLVRLADAAMYQLKQSKKTRLNWWQVGVAEGAVEQPESPLDGYGAECNILFTEFAELFDRINGEFVEDFYRDLAKDPASLALLGALSEEQFAELKRRQAAYLAMLVDPGTTRECLLGRARHLGEIHLLGGVSGSMLARASMRYRALLAEHLGAARLPMTKRYRLLGLFDLRMQDELHAQFSAAEAVSRTYLEVFAREQPARGARWSDASQQELAFLARLPGVVAVALTRLHRTGALVVEASAFAQGSDPVGELFASEGLPELDPESPKGRSATSSAWRNEAIARIDSWAQDERVAPWRDAGARLGIRSHVSIPFAGRDGHVVGVVSLFGRQTAQFASSWMQEWCSGLRRRLEVAWGRCAMPGRSVELSQGAALRYRDRLFAGGLEMFVQPTVDLESGRVSHVEALARLRMSDGEVIAPSVFLPPLGEIELDRVFRLGLDLALDALGDWDARGLALDLSINLPPSTLLDPDCAQWVEAALRKRGIAPKRLTLELLETQEFDPPRHGRAIEALRGVGVGVAIDDLGTGYSSIERIAAYRFDVIKIDQTLIRRVYESPMQTVKLVGALVLLGRDLGQRVVVEGIEDRAMLEVAAAFGADHAQGYLFAKPMPVAELPSWMAGFSRTARTEATRIQTFAGALAYHWRYMHATEVRLPRSALECPVGRFLEGREDCAEGVRLHRLVHAGGPDGAGAAEELLEWLSVRAAKPMS
ncbi:MAG: EAL domain-containing protein [Betaproteobacteria bacterium]|nr:EAL domain-containing protein [Betaproteobacteria bacterium]MBU6511052.1 EAL domain-containing protein [Betaproteobacteria bacterium]MDE2151379.1 EAL domain-containing protein [Betaproteobacteria bacterium]